MSAATAAARDAIPSDRKTSGMICFVIDASAPFRWDGATWVPFQLPGSSFIPGMDGNDGEDGAPGPRGVDGAVGAMGATGNTGSVGATGPTGPQGVPGIDGLDGSDGADGPMGPQGVAGATGANGSTGSTGSAGATGAQGPAVFMMSETGGDESSMFVAPGIVQSAADVRYLRIDAGAVVDIDHGQIVINVDAVPPDQVVTY